MTTPSPHEDHDEEDGIHRTLPHSLEAEKGLLSCALLDPARVIGEHEGRVSAASFYLPAHQTLWQMLCDAWHRQAPLDVITLTQNLRNVGQLDAVGGPAFVSDLFGYVPTTANANHYREIIEEKATRRAIIAAATSASNQAFDAATPLDELRDGTEAGILAATRDSAAQRQVGGDPRAETLAAVEELCEIYEGRRVPGLKLGLAPLDDMVRGVRMGEVIVLAARPSHGKSALAMNIAEWVALGPESLSARETWQPGAVGVFTLEMVTGAQRRRILCSRARVNAERIDDRTATDGDFARLNKAAVLMAGAPLFFDDTRGISINELRARARRWHAKHGLKLLIIDYLQLLKSTSAQARTSREREISDISEGVKTLAGELRIPILVLAQLNRDMERGAGGPRAPRLSDLRESGSLEQDADVVLLLQNLEMQARDEDERAEAKGKAVLHVAKQREGPTGPIPLTFQKTFTRFFERAPETREALPAAPVARAYKDR